VGLAWGLMVPLLSKGTLDKVKVVGEFCKDKYLSILMVSVGCELREEWLINKSNTSIIFFNLH
jgi:hypothetical protein